MNGPTGEGNNGCEEILAFIVVGIGGIALLKKMAPKIIGHLEHGFAITGCSAFPGRACLILGCWGRLVLPTWWSPWVC